MNPFTQKIVSAQLFISNEISIFFIIHLHASAGIEPPAVRLLDHRSTIEAGGRHPFEFYIQGIEMENEEGREREWNIF